MGNGLGLDYHHHFVDADLIVHLDRLDAALRITRDGDSAVGERVGIQPSDGRAGGSWTRVKRDSNLFGLPLMLIVRLPEPASEVGFKVLGNAAPSLQQLLVGTDAASDVWLVRAEEGLHRQCSSLTCLLVVGAAEGVDVIRPVVGRKRTNRVGVLDLLLVGLDVRPQNRCRIRGRRQHADALLGSKIEAG